MDTSASLGNDGQLFPPAALRSLANATVDLAARDHEKSPDFNYRFLIFLILTFVLFTFFVLYFNRLFASIVSYGIRTWTWHKHRVYLDISALQISLLGGRIFFTGLRYHGSNETFLIQHGYVTWRYWLRRVREVDIIADNPAEGAAPGKEKNAKLPCRVTVNLIGVEWFVYNRSPQYDSILAGLNRNHSQNAQSTATADTDEKESLRERRTGHSAADGEDGNRRSDPARAPEAEKGAPSDSSSPTDRRTSIASDSPSGHGDRIQKRSDLPFLVQFFPIHVECDRAAVVIGNENTKGILTAKAKTISAVVDASRTDTVDPYRQVFKIDFQQPVVQIKENEDYKSDQPARATGNTGVTKVATKANRFRRWWRKTLAPLRRMVPRWARSARPNPLESDAALAVDPRIPGSDQWQGLSRYLNDQDQDDKERWSSVEYAAESTVLDSPAATLVVYWDIVSKVTAHARQRRSTDIHIDINGTTAPAWGMDLAIKGGQVSYGPWTDRRRADLQRVFFPTLCKDAIPAEPLAVGAWRVPTKFNLRIELEETVSVRVPFREQSKNWRWRGKETQLKLQNVHTGKKRGNRAKKEAKGEASQQRPAAWLEFKVSPDSSVAYHMDMLASASGYQSGLTVDLTGSELRSAVNQNILWRGGSHRIECDLSTPLSWNSLRLWSFKVELDDLELFLLRDHIFLLIDLIDDWSTGPPPDYLVFTPFQYCLDLRLQRLKLYLNVNEGNIIDKPTSLDDNAYLILSTPLLAAKTSIPLDKYRPEQNAIPFDVRSDTLDLLFHSPQWTTQAAFTKCGELGRVHGLTANGTYHYNATTSPANTDTLVLNIHGNSPYAYLHGFVIRYFLLLKDNYFGEHNHFRTLDEYQEQLQPTEKTLGLQTPPGPPNKKSNDLDVILNIKTDDPRIMLPTNLYSSSQYVQAELSTLSVDLRFTNYYMDMELDISPLNLSLTGMSSDPESPEMESPNTQLFVDGIRVFGHRLFGLPPTEPTYLCNWDVSAGAVSGECTAEFLAALARGGTAFAFTFDDVENALVPYSSLVFDDVTFARVDVESVHLWLHVDEAAILLSTDRVTVNSNDWANSHYSKRADIDIPNIQVSCVDSESAARHKARPDHPVDTIAYLQTNVRMASIGRKLHFSEKRSLQQELVRREDQRTTRTPFLLKPDYLDEFLPDPIEPPAQCAPAPPHPLHEAGGDGLSLHSISSSSRNSQRLSRKSSFLSLPGSTASSLRRSHDHRGRDARTKAGHGAFHRPSAHMDRALSGATDDDHGHSAFHQHSSVAFASQYYAPYFTLAGVQPDASEVPLPAQHTEPPAGVNDFLSGRGQDLHDIDASQFDEEHAYTSLMVEFTTAVTAFISPAAIKHGLSLASALQPTEPDDILDTLQTSSVGKIFDGKKDKEARGSVNDLLVKLPHASVRILNSSTFGLSQEVESEERDQYDVSITELGLVTRTTSHRGVAVDSLQMGSKTSLHLRLGSVELSASERSSTLEEPQAAVMVQIDQVVVSVGAREITYFDADVGSIVGSTASGEVEYLASLLHRTASLANELEAMVKATTRHYNDRLQYFTYRLLEEGHSTPDPSFLIRPSAVLRSAESHLRTLDSWKLVMRLRQIWTVMTPESQHQFLQDSATPTWTVPPDAAELVIAAFQRWRSWDLDNISNAVVLRKIFPTLNETQPLGGDGLPVLGACRLGDMHFVLDPGPKENKVGIVDVSVRVQKKMKSDAAMLPETNTQNAPLTAINICCNEGAIHFNWEICELIEDVLRLYNQSQERGKAVAKSARKRHRSDQSAARTPAFHVVAEVIQGSIEVETVNLRSTTVTESFKVSALMYGVDNGARSQNVITHCASVTSSLESHALLLSVFQLRDPSIFASLEHEESDEASTQIVKSTASSSSLKYVVKQDPTTLLEILDRLLKDEATQINQLLRQVAEHRQPQPKHKKDTNVRQRLSTFRFNVALFLKRYIISVPLLQTLTYKITGNVARTSCAANFGREILFDFDVKENSHEMHIDVRDEPRRISLMQIPPTNGRIRSQFGQSEHVLTVLSSVELMQLDASAVYSLLGALNRPQISSTIEEIQEQVKVVQRHFGDVFRPDNETPPDSTTNKPDVGDSGKQRLIYDVHLTFAGLQVSAITPLGSYPKPVSQVLFSLDKLQLQAANRLDPQAPIMKYPEVHFNLKQIGFDIRKGQRNAMRSCGRIGAGVTMSAGAKEGSDGKEDWAFDFRSPDLDVNLSPEMISTSLAVLAYLRDRIKDLDTSRELDYLRKLRESKPRITTNDSSLEDEDEDIIDSVLSRLVYQFELQNIRASWNVETDSDTHSVNKEDLVLSIKLIQFGTRTKRSARLTIDSLQLQTVPQGQDKTLRSLHSALLPEVIFNVAYISTPNARRMAFQAVGQSLDLRLTSAFIVPAANLMDSISKSINHVQDASAGWGSSLGPEKTPKKDDHDAQSQTPVNGPRAPDRPWNLFGKKRLESMLIDADFAGAVVHVSSKRNFSNAARVSKLNRPSLAGKYGQFNADDSGSGAVLRSPGLAWKLEFSDNGHDDPTVSGEIKIDASSNILYPSVVPLVLDIVSSVQEVVGRDKTTAKKPDPPPPSLQPQQSNAEDTILTADPSAVLGRTKLNLGLRICKQEFSLSCQPIARVAATTCFESIYFTANTVTSTDHGNFFAISGTFDRLKASVQHVYSRESTGSVEIQSTTLSLMNSKHVSGTSGVSAILNFSPMKVTINAKQVQDFLLFREIWYPAELRGRNTAPVAKLTTENSQGHLMQRYQQVAATAAFPWTATISIAALDVAVDLGQAIGKSVFCIADFWISSKKTSDWEQNLCLGFQRISIDCSGRLSGFIALQDFKLRTSIQWPKREQALNETPLVQASIGFNALRIKAAFDYQAFLVADITRLELLMYNVREDTPGRGDRLVAIFDGEAVQMFGTTTSTAQAVALYQAIKKLIQERQDNFQSSLREIEKFMKRKSSTTARYSSQPSDPLKSPGEERLAKAPISLDTDVVVTLKALNLGVFPSTFSDHQVFKIEALNAYARFAASLEAGRVHSILKLTLGQLRIGLAGVRNGEAPRALSEISVDDVVQRATGSRGGTILKVPQVSAVMETWQTPESNLIHYIFKSAFEGKVEVGWNYSRISFIRGMWANHSRSVETTWGKELLPMATVKITGVPEGEGEHKEGEQQKITAEVNVPQSKYTYVALEPPVIETPQLRDMGEATPPLEWIGLHRERLPNLTHQIVIVSLLELAGEVDDAYSSILGAS
ncbi:uncharacterized protein F5Z01DRAFT_717790 [Emericellopsis atlantica]|uniref:Fermentation associated protein n=1 Tax=Emericellopsis atlantica TaxID=2614577 RepID=A0A9P7ZTL9_9HYPO|nr:uncharacterized protein F5Z01DRAFT_717790 [Emericellopsis atlantica]KAG9258040.1 hypothetical protein F5Z01DRAFT_717790 [Emericellopsis atlantica]